MIVKETLDNNLTRTFSDKGFYIRKVGTNEEYEDAIDISADCKYEETDKKIHKKEMKQLKFSFNFLKNN